MLIVVVLHLLEHSQQEAALLFQQIQHLAGMHQT